MNNLIHLKHRDPIIDQWTNALDKDAAYKTIAFKFFGGDSDKLDIYLDKFGESLTNIKVKVNDMANTEVREYRQLAMF